jgi:heat shock protein HslJ
VSADELTEVDWVLVRGVSPIAGHPVTARFDGESISGSSGCNRYRAALSIDGNGLSVGPAMSTMMACAPDVMAVEREVLARLQRATRWSIDRDGLALGDEDDELLVFAAVSSDELTGAWTITSVHRPDRQAIVSVVDGLAVHIDGDAVSGHTGVNRFNGEITVRGRSVEIGPLRTTRMAGPPDAMELEADLLAAFDATSTWSLTGDVLTLERADGSVAVTLLRTSAR